MNQHFHSDNVVVLNININANDETNVEKIVKMATEMAAKTLETSSTQTNETILSVERRNSLMSQASQQTLSDTSSHGMLMKGALNLIWIYILIFQNLMKRKSNKFQQMSSPLARFQSVQHLN